MIHEAYMPVYMGSRFLARDGTGRTEVVQEALADLKSGASLFLKLSCQLHIYFEHNCLFVNIQLDKLLAIHLTLFSLCTQS